MEKIKFDPPPPLSLREVLPVIYYTGKERERKGERGKVCERGSTFHGWQMRGLSCPVKPTKSVPRGKRFHIVWEPPSMKLPWDCS